MGDSTIASCKACGYTSPLLKTGGGIRNFRTFEARAVHCAHCRDVATANMKAPTPACLRCGGNAITVLPQPGPSACPKCGEDRLFLRYGGLMWD